MNDIAIYSKYRPSDDALRWINTVVDLQVDSYVLIGLGLGYHLKALSAVAENKLIIVYYFEKKEYELFKLHNKDKWWQQPNIQIKNDLIGVELHESVQLLLPNVWLKAIGEQHALYALLDTIKVNQLSYKRFELQMAKNFGENIKLNDYSPYPLRTSNIACLVASGPSLNETIYWLKKVSEQVDIYVVGSALKKIIAMGIVPRAAVISDAQDNITEQLEGTNFNGDLYYLSTANYKAIASHRGRRYMLCQQGYKDAELLARQANLPLLETGGSVATITFSLIETLGYESVVLFGQDLGYTGNETHASDSTSGKTVSEESRLQVQANDGSMISTVPNLQIYLRWFEQKVEDTPLKVYNTAVKGAKVIGAPLIYEQQFYKIIN
ncbi:motility associated factor glycosyltransferase family protein [Solibacillus silvestris]|uniref:motility associated factor glycosyltransferase family protein n=1 Tax=Solibacillus silvestris TaxID=76853 RepID=UPI003F81BCCA